MACWSWIAKRDGSKVSIGDTGEVEKAGKSGYFAAKARRPDFPAFTFGPVSAIITAMLNWDNLFELLAALVRAVFVDELSEHVRTHAGRLVLRPRLRGMRSVRRHIHRRCRRRLFNRLSTKD